MAEETQTYDDKKAQEAGLSPRKDEGESNKETSPENQNPDDNNTKSDRLNDRTNQRVDHKKDNGKHKGPNNKSEKNPLTNLLKDPKKRILMWVFGSCCLNPVFWVVFFIFFLIIIVAGSSASVSTGETDDNGLCKKIVSVVLPENITAQLGNIDYNTALKHAEGVTGVNTILIAAVDYQAYNLGVPYLNTSTNEARTKTLNSFFVYWDDPSETTERLIDIGNKIQEANYLRSGEDNGYKVKTDETGQPIKGLPNITGAVTDNFAVAVALQDFYCVFVENKDLYDAEGLNGFRLSQNCFSISSQECLKKAFANKWMVNPPVSSSSSSVNTAVDPNDMGAFLFYLHVNKARACPIKPTGGSPGGGTPGGYNNEGIPDVIYYSQIDPQWSGTFIGPGGCEQIGPGGCGVASTAMVLHWYGLNTTPLDVANAMSGGYYDCSAGISHDMPGAVASSLSGGKMGATPIGSWQEALDYLSGKKTGKPVPIIVNTTYAGYGHIVVIRGMKDGNLYMNDPMPTWYGQSVIPADSFTWSGWGVYVH